MGTVTKFVDNTQYVEHISTKAIVIQNVLDFSNVNTASADVVQALKVPVDCLITNVSTYVITIEDSTATATLGDGDSAVAWKDSIDLASLGGNFAVAGTDANCFGKFYSAADTIDLTITGACDTAKVLLVATGVKCAADLA